jgi:hypothetical protein
MGQRDSGERSRWLAAVLIVTSISAASVVVHFWPVAGPAPLAASRGPILLDAPRVPGAARLAVKPAVPAKTHAPVAPMSRSLPDFPTVRETPEVIPIAEAAESPIPPFEEADPVLESRALDLFVSPPAALLQPAEAPPAPSDTLVAFPGVAITRAVTIAGRGIKMGLRATSAGVRAAF